MKFRLKRPLGNWPAGETKTREQWNDAGLHMQLLDDPDWFEKAASPEKARITIWAADRGDEREYCFYDVAPIHEESEPICLTAEQEAAIEAALNGEAPDGWTVEQMRTEIVSFADSMHEAWAPSVTEYVSLFLDHLEARKPDKAVSSALGAEVYPAIRQAMAEQAARSDAELIAFGDRVFATVVYSQRQGKASPSVEKLFAEFKGREAERVFTRDEAEAIAYAASWDYCESGLGGDGAAIVDQWLKDNNTQSFNTGWFFQLSRRLGGAFLCRGE